MKAVPPAASTSFTLFGLIRPLFGSNVALLGTADVAAGGSAALAPPSLPRPCRAAVCSAFFLSFERKAGSSATSRLIRVMGLPFVPPIGTVPASTASAETTVEAPMPAKHFKEMRWVGADNK